MRFRDIIDAVLSYAGQGSGGDFETLTKNVLNATYRRVLESGLVAHEHREFTFASVASTSQYGMPLYVRKVLNIEDPTTPRFVFNTTARAFDESFPGTTTSGTPDRAYSLGTRGVEKFPAADGTLTVESSAAADSGSNYQVRVTGFNTAGVLVTELVTLTGTTAVATSNSYDNTLGVERVTKAPASGVTIAGRITVKDSSGNTIALIPTWWDSPDYEWIEFYPIPAAAITYTVRAEMRKPPLVNDQDWPEFAQEFHDLLIWGTTMNLLPAFGKAGTADRHRITFERRMKEFGGGTNAPSNALWVFSDVQTMAGYMQRPHRPLIQGVDFGQVA